MDNDDTQKFIEAFRLAERLNSGKAYTPPPPDLEPQYRPEDAYLNGRTIKIEGLEVDAAGNFSKEFIDFDIRCVGVNLSLSRKFCTDLRHSQLSLKNDRRTEGLLGRGWVIGYEGFCEINGSKIVVTESNGRQESFIKQAERWRNADPHSLTVVTRVDDRKREIDVCKEQIRYTYRFDGRLIQISDRYGNYNEIRYIGDSPLIELVLSSCGKSLRFRYMDNRIESVTDHMGRAVRYSYTDNLLTEVENAGRGIWRFEYDKDLQKMSQITDPNGNVYMIAGYDRFGNPAFLQFGQGQRLNIDFDERNKTRNFKFNNAKLYLSVKYSRSGMIQEIVTGDGVRLSYMHDQKGNRIHHRDSRTGILTAAFDQYNRKIQERRNDGECEQWQYGDNGQLKKHGKSNGYECIYNYDQTGSLAETRTKINAGVTAVETFKSDARGRRVSYTDTNKNTTIYQYKTDHNAYPQIVQYANGFKLEREYDELNRLIKEDNLGVQRRFTYNNSDKVIREIYGNGNGWLARYDYLGRILDAIPPIVMAASEEGDIGKGRYRYRYGDLYSTAVMTTPMGKTKNFPEDISLSYRGNKAETNENHATTDYMGNILEKRTPVPGAGDNQYIIAQFQYDKCNNMVHEMIGAEPVHADETPVSFAVKSLEYDNRGNLSHVHINSGEDRKFFYKGVNRLVRETVSINKTTEQRILFEYNEAGLLSVKAEMMDFGDADIEKIDKAVKNLSAVPVRTLFSYDHNGRLTKITLPSGNALALEYDQDGGLRSGLMNEDGAESAAGRSRGCYPYDAEAKKESRCSRDETPESIIYDKFSRIIRKAFGDGLFELFEYDNAGNIAAFTNIDGLPARFIYNSINKLREQVDFAGRRLLFFYSIDGGLSSFRKL